MGVTEEPLLIWGAGAMGGTIGGVLADEGRQVRFVDQAREHLQAMNERGLRVTGPVTELQVAVEATHPEDLQGTFSTVLLCVKAHHTREALAQLRAHLSDAGAVVSIQNGLCELEIAEVVGPERTVGAFVNFGADYLEPGVIHWGGRGAVVVGELDGRTSRRVETTYETLQLFEPTGDHLDELAIVDRVQVHDLHDVADDGVAVGKETGRVGQRDGVIEHAK